MEKTVWHEIIMDAESADETVSTVIGPAIAARCREMAFYIEWSTGVTAGVVEVETASHAAYTGTWDSVATTTYTSGAPKSEVVVSHGVGLAFRARISTAVANGTVTVTFVGN